MVARFLMLWPRRLARHLLTSPIASRTRASSKCNQELQLSRFVLANALCEFLPPWQTPRPCTHGAAEPDALRHELAPDGHDVLTGFSGRKRPTSTGDGQSSCEPRPWSSALVRDPQQNQAHVRPSASRPLPPAPNPCARPTSPHTQTHSVLLAAHCTHIQVLMANRAGALSATPTRLTHAAAQPPAARPPPRRPPYPPRPPPTAAAAAHPPRLPRNTPSLQRPRRPPARAPADTAAASPPAPTPAPRCAP